jgi:dihydropyrimidinase
MAQILIRGGTVVTAEGSSRADVLIDGEHVKQVGNALRAPDAAVVEASGKLILPGGVDPHTHFDLPMFDTVSSDDHYTGHKAAAFGGTTTVIDFVPQPDSGTLHAGLQAWHAKADGRAAIDFGFHMNITRLAPGTLEEIPRLVEEGVTTLKVFTAYNNRLRLPDGEIFQVMRVGGKHGLLTMLHAENGDVIEVLVAEALAAGHRSPEWHAHTRPAWGEVEAALRGIALAAQAQAPLYLVHMNVAGELDQLRFGRARGVPVMGETCLPYLFFTVDDLRREDGAKWICSPPMRTAEDNAALWGGLTDGSMQVVATDHCPFFYDGTRPILYEGRPVAIPGKELGRGDFTKIPNGVPGVGDRMPVLWTAGVVRGRITASQFVALTSTNPANIFGLYPRKGAIEPGSDADVVIWDPERRLTYGVAHTQHRTDYNLYEGWELHGFPEKVYLRGQLIVDGERWLGRSGMGTFLHRQPFAPIL